MGHPPLRIVPRKPTPRQKKRKHLRLIATAVQPDLSAFRAELQRNIAALTTDHAAPDNEDDGPPAA